MKNLFWLALLSGATLTLAMICWHNWPASAKKKPILLVMLLVGFSLGCLLTVLVPKLLASSWWIFIAVEIIAVLMGVYFAVVVSYLNLSRNQSICLLVLLTLCYVLFVCTAIWAFSYWTLITSLAAALLWRAQVMLFLTVTIIEMSKAFYNIPPPAYPPWSYPASSIVQDIIEEDMNELLVVGLRIRKTFEDDRLTYFRARAPLHISWGDFFYHFLNDYNEKHPESTIEVADANGDAFNWQFYRLRKFWPPSVVDFTRPVQFTGIKENSVIVCMRV